jgi:hypothetical protein
MEHQGGMEPQTLTDEESAAFVARAYPLYWINGAQRFYWYAWDDQWRTSPRLTSGAAGYPGQGDNKGVNGLLP